MTNVLILENNVMICCVFIFIAMDWDLELVYKYAVDSVNF